MHVFMTTKPMPFLVAIILALVALAAPQARAQVSNDAVAVRVLPNPAHQSALDWYYANIPADRQGSPAETSVDGYPAVRDGRSVYVNAGNAVKPLRCLDEQGTRHNSGSACQKIGDSCSYQDVNAFLQTGTCGGYGTGTLYTNIYILSHTQDAASDTADIFGQLLKNWTFNVNLLNGTPIGPGPGACAVRATGETPEGAAACYTDRQCGSPELYCTSMKAKVTRDVIRLGHKAELEAMLEAYQNAHNDQAPQLAAGTYLQGKSISVWPSWQQTLGAAFNKTLPVDPLNALWGCASPANDGTCWNETKKEFTAGDANIPVPTSIGYVYSYVADDETTAAFTVRRETELEYSIATPSP